MATKSIEHVVHGCRSCPYYYIKDDSTDWCSLHKKLRFIIVPKKNDEVPSSCPLLKKNVVITLKHGNKNK